MRKLVYILSALFCFLLSFHFSEGKPRMGKLPEPEPVEQLLKLSKKKWTWIINRQIDSLDSLFHENIVSRQPGIGMDKPGLLDVIANGNIQYDHIDIRDTDIQIIGDTSILLTKVVFNYLGDKESEVKNVTEVYQKYDNEWKLILLQISQV